MGFVRFEIPCPKSSWIVPSVDPNAKWTFDGLSEELKVLESRLAFASPMKREDISAWESRFHTPLHPKRAESIGFSKEKEESTPSHSGLSLPLPPKHNELSRASLFISYLLHIIVFFKFKMCLSIYSGYDTRRKEGYSSGSFVMSISDEDTEDDTDSEEYLSDREELVKGTRFHCLDLDLSDSEDSAEELCLETSHLLRKQGPEEAIMLLIEYEHELEVKMRLRDRRSSLEEEIRNEHERLLSAFSKIKKYVEIRKAMDRKLDNEYQRKIAAEMDLRLSAIRRDYEEKSQIEEKKIRDVAALEEARRKEKALQEEKIRKEKAKAEYEAKLKEDRLLAEEEARRKALEAAEKEEKEAARARERIYSESAPKDAFKGKSATSEGTTQDAISHERAQAVKVFASDAALKAEETRLKLYDEVSRQMGSGKEFGKCSRKIGQLFGQINGTQGKVRDIATSLIQILRSPMCPGHISSLLFAQMALSSVCENPNKNFDSIYFACGHIVLLVASQVPSVIEFLVAALQRACIYAVPKHLQPAGSIKSKDYKKLVGYQEENGNYENFDRYLERMESYMKLYAVIIQTEIHGIVNPYGLKEGWLWITRFLNHLPPNVVTATALRAFLKMAGFALFRKYKSQLMKILNYISRGFLPALRKHGDEVNKISIEIEIYLNDKEYMKRPEGSSLQSVGLLSLELS